MVQCIMVITVVIMVPLPLQERRLYQTTHSSFQNLEPESTLYFQLRTDISGRLSILSDAVSVNMPSIGKVKYSGKGSSMLVKG